jgi:hypothetical protein
MGVIGQTLGFAAGAAGLFFSGWLAGRSQERLKKIDLREPSARWQQLPSGWSKDYGALTIYAMTMDDGAYWWVSRNGKTIIEGPCDTLANAQRSAEQEAKELSP